MHDQIIINNLPAKIGAVNRSGDKRSRAGSATSNYVRSVLQPELKLSARIPSLFALPTIALQQVTTLQFNVGSTGNFNFLYRPVFCCDDTASGNKSTFYYNNNCNFDAVTASGYIQAPMPPAIPSNVASAYRLVSASLLMYVNGALINMKGRMGLAIHTDNFSGTPVANTNTTTFGISSPEFNSITISQTSMHYSEAAVLPGNALRAVYLPFDPTFLQFLPINSRRADLTSIVPDEFMFIGYGVGLNPGDNVQFRLHLNYEFEPHGSAFPLALAQRTHEKGSAESAISSVASEVVNGTSVTTSDSSKTIEINKMLNSLQIDTNNRILDKVFGKYTSEIKAAGNKAAKAYSFAKGVDTILGIPNSHVDFGKIGWK